MNCRICGRELSGRAVSLCEDCRAEANRQAAREYYHRQKALGNLPSKEHKRKPRTLYNVLPAGQWFRAVCSDDDEARDWIPPNREYSREAVRDFVRYGAPVKWFEVVR